MRSSTHTHPAPSLGRYWLLPAIPPMASQDPAAAYHPGFDTPGADGLSSSLDGMLFRLPSSVLLRPALTVLRSLLGAPLMTSRCTLTSRDLGIERRASIAAPAFIRERLPVYALATRFVSEDEAEFASQHMSGPRYAH
ncbi:hypothetical protein ARMGADRAFT_609264 [Armillaria gallica]|uniref:Uncharacterized protein n=1 Tax=Armillaria gallica TaxID=47427 RepID=A0A2H3DAC4_ARMGA|nr:hypothetical protein ARMGADRAFT_609264 [Armillaria gallica]